MKHRLFIQKVGAGFNQMWLSELTVTKGWWIFKHSVPLEQFEHASLSAALIQSNRLVMHHLELTVRIARN